MKMLLAALALVASSPCAALDGRGDRQTESQPPRVVRAQPIPTGNALRADTALLPAGVRGKFPSYDGDSFAFTFAPRSSPVSAPRETFDELVAPLMRAMGFGARVASMRVPGAGNAFQQTESGVAIETAVVVVMPSSAHGTLFDRYSVANTARLSAEAAVSAAADFVNVSRPAEMVLLPYGSAADGRVALRHAWRVLLAAREDRSRTWQAWIDAESGSILQLTPQFDREPR